MFPKGVRRNRVRTAAAPPGRRQRMKFPKVIRAVVLNVATGTQCSQLVPGDPPGFVSVHYFQRLTVASSLPLLDLTLNLETNHQGVLLCHFCRSHTQRNGWCVCVCVRKSHAPTLLSFSFESSGCNKGTELSQIHTLLLESATLDGRSPSLHSSRRQRHSTPC